MKRISHSCKICVCGHTFAEHEYDYKTYSGKSECSKLTIIGKRNLQRVVYHPLLFWDIRKMVKFENCSCTGFACEVCTPKLRKIIFRTKLFFGMSV